MSQRKHLSCSCVCLVPNDWLFLSPFPSSSLAPHVDVLVCLHRLGRGERQNGLSGISYLKTSPWTSSYNLITSSYHYFFLGYIITSTVKSRPSASQTSGCKSCIRDFWFSSENFQFRCPSLEVLFRCLDPTEERITNSITTRKHTVFHSTDRHVGRKFIGLLLPVSFQDWNLLPSQILDNLYVSTNRSHRCNDVYICIYICAWEKWKQKRHKADRLEKGRGYRTRWNKHADCEHKQQSCSFKTPVRHRKDRLMKPPSTLDFRHRRPDCPGEKRHLH